MIFFSVPKRDGGPSFSQRGLRLVMVAMAMAVLPGLVGCGDDGPKTYPVKGKFLYKDGKPVTSGDVLFESLVDPKVQASGQLQPDGSFELASNLGKPGTLAGEHRVMILPPMAEFGQKAAISNKYASFETSGLTAKVTEGENSLTIELDK